VSDSVQKYSGTIFVALSTPRRTPVSRLGAPVALVETAKLIEYHLYERANGHRDFSMVGPDDYGCGGPSGFVAGFRYEHDESWTRLDEVEACDRRRAEIHGFASNRLLKS
jgi:hypothetical protein